MLSTSPFAVYYVTEARMYALVMLLVFAGYLLLQQALTRPSVAQLWPVTVIAGALSLTQPSAQFGYGGTYLPVSPAMGCPGAITALLRLVLATLGRPPHLRRYTATHAAHQRTSNRYENPTPANIQAPAVEPRATFARTTSRISVLAGPLGPPVRAAPWFGYSRPTA